MGLTQVTKRLLNLFTGAGSLLISNASNQAAELSAGSAGQVLTMVSGEPAWQTSSSSLPWTTAGDLVYYGASGPARLPIGSVGQVISVVSGEPAWAANTPTLPWTTAGDLIYYGSSGAARLPIGTPGEILQVVAGEPTWQYLPQFVEPLSATSASVVTGISSTYQKYVEYDQVGGYLGVQSRILRVKAVWSITPISSTQAYTAALSIGPQGQTSEASTTALYTHASAALSTSSTYFLQMDVDIVVNTTGTSGTLYAIGFSSNKVSGVGATGAGTPNVGGASVTFDTTANFGIYAWLKAAGSDSAASTTLVLFTVEQVN